MQTLGDIGEHEVIRRLTAKLGRHADLQIGTGDDCAVAKLPGSTMDQVLTTDPVVENVHFESLAEPARIGNKAAGRVLSDIAAMGAQPQWLLINVVAPSSQPVEVLENIYDGIVAACARFGATVIGGDLAEGPCLELHVFGTGILPAGSALLRSGAQVNDILFVSGTLGNSIKGKHLDFIPRVEEGIFLRETGLVTSMMDISDGLATDLRHILSASGVGAVVEADRIPSAGTLDNALYDGEDFELLFTVSAENSEELRRLWMERFDLQLSMIGHISDAVEQLQVKQKDGTLLTLDRSAFVHFSSKLKGIRDE
jgi:thiamine-monophosphate kinase